MPPNVVVRAGELVAAGVVVLAVAAIALWSLKRWMRRRLERAGRAAAARAAAISAGAARAGWQWLWSRPLPDRRWIAASRARRRLWRAVSAADRAVAVARKAGAPTGDLAALCRRLQQAAAGVDRSLMTSDRGTAADRPAQPVSAEVSDLVRAAGLIADAAASAVASLRPAAASLAEDARREAEALSAGIAAASRAAAGSLPAQPG